MKRRLRLQPHNEREAFLQGAQSLCQLKHPHLLAVIDVGFRDGWPYVIMEHATGRSLRQRLDRQASTLLPTEEILTLIEQISQALDYLHEQHIIHGNVKPENILFTEHDQALLSDLDPMTLSETANTTDLALHATSPYIAPEQMAGQGSCQSDQYALGCIAYELFTGHPAFSSPDLALQHNLSTETVIPPTQINPSLAPQIEQVILKAMAKDASSRYESVFQFNQALHAATGLSIAFSSTAIEIQAEDPVPLPSSFENATLPVEDSGLHEEHEENHIALSSKLAPPTTPSQISQKRGARTKTAVQIWLIVACVGIALGATSELFHLFYVRNNPSQESGTIIQHRVLSPQAAFSSPVAHPSRTTIPTPTVIPTPLLTPTIIAPTPIIIVPTPTPSPLPPGKPRVDNAGFERPSLGYGNYQYSPTSTRWTFSNGAGITANGSVFTSKNSNAPRGTQVAFLHNTGLMSQTISFAAGSYQISFYAAQRKKNNANIQDFQILMDGQVIGTFTPSGFKYKQHSTASFAVTAGNHVLTFQGLDSKGGDNTALIDVVAIQ